MVESHLGLDIGLCGRGGRDLLVRKPTILILGLYGLRNVRIGRRGTGLCTVGRIRLYRVRRIRLFRAGRVMMGCIVLFRIGRIRMELVRWRKIILMMLILKFRKGRLGLRRRSRLRVEGWRLGGIKWEL